MCNNWLGLSIQALFIFSIKAHAPKDYNGYKIVCYYGAWAVYRKPPMAFNVTDIDPYACTHLIYAFAGLDATTNKIISLDPLVDIEEGKNLMQFDIIYFISTTSTVWKK